MSDVSSKLDDVKQSSSSLVDNSECGGIEEDDELKSLRIMSL
ncbi:hypothetical protein [Wolbachia pipientis]|nr:hypothetical protein [Wolbachia pipientis]MDM8335293.1 hypothetical protein [Wolbachia pipientis]